MTGISEQLLLDSPAARPCTCVRVKHEHGTLGAYRSDRCRCRPCADANTAYMRHRDQQIAYGRWAGYVDAGPARKHVRQLIRKHGMSVQGIAARAGLSTETVRRLLRGIPSRRQPPPKRLRGHTSDALLAITSGRMKAAKEPDLWTSEATP